LEIKENVELDPMISFKDMLPNQGGNHESGTWNLLSTLFDSQTLLQVDEQHYEYVDAHYRKEKLSRWFQTMIETKEQDIHGLVFKRALDKAIQLCIEKRNYRLASILAQVGGPGSTISTSSFIPNGVPGSSMDTTTQELLSNQVLEWKDSTLNPFYDIWCLVSGNVSTWSNQIFQNCTNWQHTLALFFWYASGGMYSISEAITIYTENFKEYSDIKQPLFQKTFDIQYLILKMIGDESIEMKDVVALKSHTTELPISMDIEFILGSKTYSEICK
jgi:hypothetical protein